MNWDSPNSTPGVLVPLQSGRMTVQGPLSAAYRYLYISVHMPIGTFKPPPRGFLEIIFRSLPVNGLGKCREEQTLQARRVGLLEVPGNDVRQLS